MSKNQIKRDFQWYNEPIKQKQDTKLVYTTYNREPCILVITLRLTLKFQLIIKNAFLKNCKY